MGLTWSKAHLFLPPLPFYDNQARLLFDIRLLSCVLNVAFNQDFCDCSAWQSFSAARMLRGPGRLSQSSGMAIT